MTDAGMDSLRLTAPFAIGGVVVGIVASAIQVKPGITTEILKPRFSVLNPISGAKRLLSSRSLVTVGQGPDQGRSHHRRGLLGPQGRHPRPDRPPRRQPGHGTRGRQRPGHEDRLLDRRDLRRDRHRRPRLRALEARARAADDQGRGQARGQGRRRQPGGQGTAEAAPARDGGAADDVGRPGRRRRHHQPDPLRRRAALRPRRCRRRRSSPRARTTSPCGSSRRPASRASPSCRTRRWPGASSPAPRWASTSRPTCSAPWPRSSRSSTAPPGASRRPHEHRRRHAQLSSRSALNRLLDNSDVAHRDRRRRHRRDDDHPAAAGRCWTSSSRSTSRRRWRSCWPPSTRPSRSSSRSFPSLLLLADAVPPGAQHLGHPADPAADGDAGAGHRGVRQLRRRRQRRGRPRSSS